jgi:predicted TIM-barrel fold metal-dependent hydrolase
MMTKIDIFSHIMTPQYTEKFANYNPKIKQRVEYEVFPVIDLGVREKLMHRYPDVLQVLTMANIPLEKWATREQACELAKLGNEELANLVLKRPDLFFGAVGVVPMNNMDDALNAIDYAIRTLHLAGIQLYTRIGPEQRGLADPQYRPIFQKMAEYDKPIWIHPDHNDAIEFDAGVISWPFETTTCMYRLIESGIFHKFPNLKLLVHHAGAMVPFFSERLKYVLATLPTPFPNMHEHFKKFYVDTAVYGNTSALMCAVEYYGADHMFFGTDAPLGPHWGMVEDTVRSIERMAISDDDKHKILKYNAIELFKDVV